MSGEEKPWSAIVLAAGLGTRLLPHTSHTPKPLFTIDERPLLDIIIRRLQEAGCANVVVNTHHLHEKIEAFLKSAEYEIEVKTSHEPKILDTGGAIKNNADILGQFPFMVINGDIYTDIDLRAVYRFHAGAGASVTMVMHDHERFNNVWVDRENLVIGFEQKPKTAGNEPRLMAFTGIHVMDPSVVAMMPERGTPFGIIQFYEQLIKGGYKIKAMVVDGCEWEDIGTPESYMATAFRETVRSALCKSFGRTFCYDVEPIHPDGSDAKWSRIVCPSGTLVACERGIQEPGRKSECASFAAIGSHLLEKGVAVPRIYRSDLFAGISVMEDLGCTTLQNAVNAAKTEEEIETLYGKVFENLAVLATKGAQGFDESWCWQTGRYDRNVILDLECRYFARAFLSGYLGMDAPEDRLKPEFEALCDLTLSSSTEGLIHRDMQSRNIMIKEGKPFFIDFQGARKGPIQYDIASLLIDPYVKFSDELRGKLLQSYIRVLREHRHIDDKAFLVGYRCCAVTRNLQILGAFGHLTVEKRKPWFAEYILPAAKSLVEGIRLLEGISGKRFPNLSKTAKRALDALATRADGSCSKRPGLGLKD